MNQPASLPDEDAGGATARDAAQLRAHLLAVHEEAAGFTESCASACRDPEGRNSYDWLCDAAAPGEGASMLDLACGSGVLLELCRKRYGAEVSLTGLDMSAAELELAQARLADARVTLRNGLAQSLDFAAEGSFDAVLCHWALTLMDPLEPVLREVARVLKPGGVFAAIVDGPDASATGYAEAGAIIGAHVVKARSDYAELGDPRARDGDALRALAASVFDGADISVETGVFALDDAPERLAEEASGFFYSAFVLSDDERRAMLKDLAGFFARQASPRFEMPVNRLVVRAR